MHRPYFCWTVHIGRFHLINVLKKHSDPPQLVLDSTMVYMTGFSEDKAKIQIHAFVEIMKAYNEPEPG